LEIYVYYCVLQLLFGQQLPALLAAHGAVVLLVLERVLKLLNDGRVAYVLAEEAAFLVIQVKR